MILDSQIAQKIIDQLMSQGAEFADIFVEDCKSENVLFLNNAIESITGGSIKGAGLRIIKNGQIFYATSSDLNQSSLQKIATELLALSAATTHNIPTQEFNQYRGKPSILSQPQNVMRTDRWVQTSCFLVPNNEKIAWMDKINQKIFASHNLVSQVSISLMQREQNIEVFNSLGVCAKDFRPYLRAAVNVIVKDGTNQYAGQYTPGEMRGFEYLQNLDMQDLCEKPLQQALTMLNAGYIEAGSCPVLLGNGFGGVIFHEACGHSLETTSVAKKSSVFWDKMNQQIASPVVSAVDDGTLDYYWGSLSIDDEGRAVQRTQLIKEGVLKNFLVDYDGHLKTGYPLSGSARRESYLYPPASRMRNTFIEPGNNTFDEMISAMDNGLYAKDLGGGSVDTSTGNFNFTVLEGYKVRNGKIAEPVRGATLIGNGSDALKKITHVGKNIKLSPGTCGSVSGSIPTTVGQPEILISEIVVGGR